MNLGLSYAEPVQTLAPTIGDLVRQWRQRRRLSQLELSLDVNVSARHLCFIETGRSQPSREMILKLAEYLEVPIRDRNLMLEAGGYSAKYRHRMLTDPELASAREAVSLIVNGHEPYPALAIDRHWNLILANDTARELVAYADPRLLDPPVNVLRLSLHPCGLAPLIKNLGEWREHLAVRLRRAYAVTGDLALKELLVEIDGDGQGVPEREGALGDIAVPLRIVIDGHELTLISATTVFGMATEITLAELALETFFPADPDTAAFFRERSAARRRSG